MTNEQKANEICKKHIFDSNHYDCCMEMAQWKDEQLEKAIATEMFVVQIFDGRWISVVSVQRLKQTLKEL